jgi:hypothetical protein
MASPETAAPTAAVTIAGVAQGQYHWHKHDKDDEFDCSAYP